MVGKEFLQGGWCCCCCPTVHVTNGIVPRVNPTKEPAIPSFLIYLHHLLTHHALHLFCFLSVFMSWTIHCMRSRGKRLLSMLIAPSPARITNAESMFRKPGMRNIMQTEKVLMNCKTQSVAHVHHDSNYMFCKLRVQWMYHWTLATGS